MDPRAITTGKRVLIVDDEPAARRLLDIRVRALGCKTLMASHGHEALAILTKQEPDVVLLDLELPTIKGLQILKQMRSEGVTVPVIVVTAHGSIEIAVEAMKEGAADFITKPLDAKHLEIALDKVLEQEKIKRDIELLNAAAERRYRLIAGKSEKMKEAVEMAQKAAISNSTVLLLGESGTGKEIFARAIHTWSERRNQPFVPINCVGLSKDLLESELFGHEKGSFTGADQQKKGKMELANGGTVFLDEVGDVSAELQTKLLRFLQEREFDRVGGVRSIQVDVRIIAATNRDLDLSIREGRFREDLFHRLNVIPILLPPLRERADDIPSLAHYFLRHYAEESKKTFTEINEEAMEKLASHAWPGNVRELANVIERAVVLGTGPKLTLADLPRRIVSSEELHAQVPAFSYRQSLSMTRRNLVLKALAQCHGNRAAAARLLGLHEKYLLRLIKALQIG